MNKTTRPAQLLVILMLMMTCAFAHAGIDAFDFKTPADEARYRNLIDELRCPKCLNTNLSGSDSPIAADLRKEVHRLVTDGQSDDEIRTYLVDRYGDFILYRPRLSLWSGALYAAPAVLVLVGFGVIGAMVRRTRRNATVGAADPAAQARLDQLLKQHVE